MSTKCQAKMEGKLIEYLDGRVKPVERHAVEDHLAGCPECRVRVDEFRTISGALDDLPVITPSPAFDASLRARIAAEPVRQSFWAWLPSPRFTFALAALLILSVWMSSMPQIKNNPPNQANQAMTSQVSAQSDFRMIRDLPVLENYDVLSKFDALSELSASSPVATGQGAPERR